MKLFCEVDGVIIKQKLNVTPGCYTRVLVTVTNDVSITYLDFTHIQKL